MTPRLLAVSIGLIVTFIEGMIDHRFQIAGMRKYQVSD